MKEIYDWVPWFRELAGNIAQGGKDYLNQKADRVDWGENLTKLEYGDEGIDPFSFIYFLASKAATTQLKTVYDSVSQEFGIESPLPDPKVDDYYIFPTPQPQYGGFYEKTDSGYELLWRLFSDAAKYEPTIAPIDFEDALKLNGVGVTRLTQTMFLINPHYFQPVDNITDDLSKVLELPTRSALETDIKKEGGYEKYQTILGKLAQAFPGCQPYEVNMLLYLVRPNATNGIEVSGDFYQISTYVYDPGGGDYWNDFEENNWVYTGGPGSGKSWGEEGGYPLTEPARGDIILVRTGRQRGRAIGIVQKNDYAETGIKEDNRIHVLWISKADNGLASFTAMQGLSKAGAATFRAFETSESYKRSFELIGKLKDDSNEGESEDYEDAMEPGTESEKHPHSLNQILYGPPGTSKTWHTINHALAIIDNKPVDQLEKESEEVREGKLHRFNELKKNGQIEMVTFHQNYSYEDFIEGIRPVLAGDGQRSVEYELAEGIFKRICKRAEENRRQSEQASGESWDIDGLLEAFAESIAEKLESGIDINLFAPDDRSGATIGAVHWTGDTFKSVQLGGTVRHQRLTRSVIKRDYEAFYYGDIKSREDIKPTYRSRRSYHGNARYYFELYKQIKDFHDNQWKTKAPVSVEKQNYVLIIDEINRGNIAKIFGELITLIEASKRIGVGDATTVRLPNSDEDDDNFGVPDNLYIIGTMNTTDRSIALLDTALRRRFDFVEMMPDPTLVPDDIEGVNCQELLKVINRRIRILLDRDHQIGHTYFMNIEKTRDLVKAFKNKIIPLLQEYFYDDWKKIKLVLNNNSFVEDISGELRKDCPEELSESVDEQKEIYELLPFNSGKWEAPESYLKIYENSAQGDVGESNEDV